MSMKSNRYGTGFLTEVTGAGRGIRDVDQDVPSNLKPIDDITIFRAYKADPYFSKHNDVYRLIINALAELKMEPEIYVVGYPQSAGPNVFKIKSPTSIAGLARDVGEATKKGYPPKGFWLAVTAPDPSALENVINEAHVVWRTGWRKLRDNAESIKDMKTERSKFLDHAQTLITKLVRENVERKPILAWIELKLASKQGARQKRRQGGPTRTELQFERVGHNVGGYSGGFFTKKPTGAQLQSLRMTNEFANEHLMAIRTAMMDSIYHNVWAAFDHWVQKADDGFIQQMEEKLSSESVRKAYDETQGHTIEKDLRPKAKFTREPGSKVVGSVRGTGSTIGTMIVTASEAERDRQDAQGNWLRRPKLPKQLGEWVPAEHVTRWLQGDKYEAIFGLYYDHPLVVPIKNKQVYWYSNKNMFHKAVYQYGAMTGQAPVLVYKVFRRTGDRRGMNITRNEIVKDYSKDGQRFLRGLNEVVASFNRLAKDGVAIHNAEVAKHLGPGVTLHQDDWGDMPYPPEGVDPQGFKRYVDWVRKETRSTLGVNFMRNMPRSLIDPKTQRVKRLPHHRHQLPIIKAMYKQHKYTPEDKKEELGVYLIEYLLAHSRDAAQAETFMIPLNVLRSTENYKARMHKVTSIRKSDLMTLLPRAFPGLKVVRDPGAWVYIPPSSRQNLPYARLIRPSTVLGHELPDVNKRLPERFQRTHHGYMIDGIHWYAYQMFVVMPPSVAETELGLIRRNAFRRTIIDEPSLVDRMRRGKQGNRVSLKDFGATTRETQMRFIENPKSYRSEPYDKASLSGADIPGIVGHKTDLDVNWLLGDNGQTWEPKFEEQVHKVYNFTQRKIVEYTSARTIQDKIAVAKEYLDQMKKFENEVEFDLSTYLQSLLANTRKNMGKAGIDTAKAAQTYIRLAKKEITSDGHYMLVPTVVKDIPLGVYEAHFGIVVKDPLEFSVKAPSDSVARYFILLRLLRRSTTNPDMGKAMDTRAPISQRKIFPDLNARTLAQWAKSGFLVQEQNAPRGSYRVGSRVQRDKAELRRGEPYSQHRYGYFLRTD